ncbi:hypothetical protein SKAU_G00162650 [Synaphobranchus kaupii]|uniref:Uncharacterized protein n=1 Tax=Synaphobranchus kaupii TaxID=118154 RepID=A0A9Q1FIU0_SYNKA|nr:hypothetical protein SKAU_G00162650 [Synaphobranchus kaupii]
MASCLAPWFVVQDGCQVGMKRSSIVSMASRRGSLSVSQNTVTAPTPAIWLRVSSGSAAGQPQVRSRGKHSSGVATLREGKKENEEP